MRAALGERGAQWIAVGIAISTLGFLSQGILTAPRVYYAMARDGLFFQSVGKLSPRTGAPVVAIILQGIAATIIALSGRYEQILNYVVSIDFISFGLTAASIFVLRRQPANGRHLPHAGTSVHHRTLRSGVRRHRRQHDGHLSRQQRLRRRDSARRDSRIFVSGAPSRARHDQRHETSPLRLHAMGQDRTAKPAYNLATSGVGAFPLRELGITTRSTRNQRRQHVRLRPAPASHRRKMRRRSGLRSRCRGHVDGESPRRWLHCSSPATKS